MYRVFVLLVFAVGPDNLRDAPSPQVVVLEALALYMII